MRCHGMLDNIWFQATLIISVSFTIAALFIFLA